MMSLARVFLNWDQPILHSAADWLLEQAESTRGLASSPLVDLSQFVVVMPGSLAGRRLVEILIQSAEESGKSLVPPDVITVGELPERLYQAKLPFASELVQQLAWSETLRGTPAEELKPLIPHVPPETDLTSWREIGDTIRRVYRELASNCLDFAKVAEAATHLNGLDEAKRWAVLADLQQRYLNALDALQLWDKQTARLFAIEHNECQCDERIVLLATVDLNQATRRMLAQAADRRCFVTALVGAPGELEDRFDFFGCLLAEEWEKAELDLPWRDIPLVSGPAQQADQVAGWIAETANQYSAKDYVIGLPDESLLGELRRTLGLHGLRCRYGPGESVADSVPVRLIEAAVELARSRQYPKLASLARHPDMFSTLHFEKVGIARLDQWYNDRLPDLLDKLRAPDDLSDSLRSLLSITEPLTGERSLADWSEVVQRLLNHVYGDRVVDLDTVEDKALIRPLEAIVETISQWKSLPPPLNISCNSSDMLRILRSQLSGSMIPAEVDPDSIEVLGWLELPLSDARCRIITSFSDGFIPSGRPADMFLPNGLRQALGLEDDSFRLARDAYQVSVLHHCQGDVRWIVPKRNSDGDPAIPSRLLFNRLSDELPARINKFFGDPSTPTNAAFAVLDREEDHRQRIKIHEPSFGDSPPKFERISATRINQYLNCPYRFYLRYVLKLSACDDEATELEPLAFGNLAHETLQQFGTSEICNSTDDTAIYDFLSDTLYDLAKKFYGRNPLSTVKIQIEQLRLRFREFARGQAERRKAGWIIRYCEWEQKDPYPVLCVDGNPLELEGRIDRIDFHEVTGEWAIWDYKTGENLKSPEKEHCVGRGESRRWKSIQLPFYRHLVRALGIDAPVELGYIALPKEGDKIRFDPATWNTDELDEADEVIFQAIRDIRACQFYPPREPKWNDEFSRICQDSVLGRWEAAK